MRFRHLEQHGRHFRVADPAWRRPLEGHHSQRHGGRWNEEGSFPVVYLFTAVDVARSFVLYKHRDLPYSVLDMVPDRQPVLVGTDVPDGRHVDIVSDRGCVAAGLPASYPREADGMDIPWARCQPIGQAAWDQGEPGIACRSATARVGDIGHELAWFERDQRLRSADRQRFDEWIA